jgi:predicted nucleic acid-binding protein
MTLDANIVIAYLSGEQPVIEILSSWQKQGFLLFLSTVAETEILSFSEWTPSERFSTEKFIEENFASIPFDRTLARIAAGLRRELKIKFPDAAIAATAIYTRTPLVTRDIHHFKKIPNLKLLSL